MDSSGNVGIGTTSPSAKLDVNGDIMISGGYNTSQSPSLNAMIYKNTSGTGDFLRSGDLILEPRAGSSLIVTNNGTNQFIVNNAGNVGIGTTSPSRPLSVHRSTAGSAANFLHYTDATAFAGLYIDVDNVNNIVELNASGDTASTMAFQTGNAERMRITTTGNIGIGTTNPTSPLTIKSNSISSSASGLTIQSNGKYK